MLEVFFPGYIKIKNANSEFLLKLYEWVHEKVLKTNVYFLIWTTLAL